MARSFGSGEGRLSGGWWCGASAFVQGWEAAVAPKGPAPRTKIGGGQLPDILLADDASRALGANGALHP